MSTDNQDVSGSFLSHSIARYIRRSRRKVAILFTDIEDSTRYWEKHGDLQGRLMVDLHNRLTFPVIRKFHGKVIKTIGDSIMASFKKPENAVKAAIGMQQILENARRADETFELRVRIGIHTGLALVESHDVFGDVVNVAARVESEAKGGEILVSDSTRREVQDIDFGLQNAGRFKPKGKLALMTVYRCHWEEFESLIDDIKPGSYLPVVAKQKIAIGIYLLASVAMGYFLYLRYMRYLLADSKSIAILSLNPHLVLREYPVVIGVLAAIVLVIVVFLVRVQAASHFLLKTISGGFGFGIGYMLLFVPVIYFNLGILPASRGLIYQSQHLFVEVLEDDSPMFVSPSEDAEVIRTVSRGDILLQMNTAKRKGQHWNKVYIGEAQAGWLIRISPPKLGVPETRVTSADKFYFRYRDVYAWVLGIVGLVWGFLRFRIVPV